MDRVQKILSNFGYCSRRKAEDLIRQGRVRVNDRVITPGDKASSDDTIFVDDRPVHESEKVYIMFYKPVGCVTSLADPEHRTIMEYIDVPERVFPVGRLDINSSGLLILTNDGDFANHVMHPRYEIGKSYRATLDRAITNKDIRRIERGVMLSDGKTAPAHVDRVGKKRVIVTIHEGRYRVVRRIFDQLGFRVKKLKRVMIGKLELGSLRAGEYEYLRIPAGKEPIDLIR